VLTTAEGTTLRMNAAGETTVEKADDSKKGLTSQNIRVIRHVTPTDNGEFSVVYEIINAGIDDIGLVGVRIGTIEGLWVETDRYGRFHIAGMDVKRMDRGGNFLMKLDTATLPLGSVLTTKNPQVRRITQGMPVRFDFGIKVPAKNIKPAKITPQKNNTKKQTLDDADVKVQERDR
jgi:hypothetical protein